MLGHPDLSFSIGSEYLLEYIRILIQEIGKSLLMFIREGNLILRTSTCGPEWILIWIPEWS
jgi:hypothetical protein